MLSSVKPLVGLFLVGSFDVLGRKLKLGVDEKSIRDDALKTVDDGDEHLNGGDVMRYGDNAVKIDQEALKNRNIVINPKFFGVPKWEKACPDGSVCLYFESPSPWGNRKLPAEWVELPAGQSEPVEEDGCSVRLLSKYERKDMLKSMRPKAFLSRTDRPSQTSRRDEDAVQPGKKGPKPRINKRTSDNEWQRFITLAEDAQKKQLARFAIHVEKQKRTMDATNAKSQGDLRHLIVNNYRGSKAFQQEQSWHDERHEKICGTSLKCGTEIEEMKEKQEKNMRKADLDITESDRDNILSDWDYAQATAIIHSGMTRKNLWELEEKYYDAKGVHRSLRKWFPLTSADRAKILRREGLSAVLVPAIESLGIKDFASLSKIKSPQSKYQKENLTAPKKTIPSDPTPEDLFARGLELERLFQELWPQQRRRDDRRGIKIEPPTASALVPINLGLEDFASLDKMRSTHQR